MSEHATAEIMDRATLNALKEAGSDLSKPHLIEHLLFLPSEIAGRDAAAVLVDRGYNVELHPPEDDWHPDFWQLQATKSIVPTWSNIREMRRQIEDVTGPSGGDYDGWGAQGVK
jgi:hypothetical protein